MTCPFFRVCQGYRRDGYTCNASSVGEWRFCGRYRRGLVVRGMTEDDLRGGECVVKPI